LIGSLVLQFSYEEDSQHSGVYPHEEIGWCLAGDIPTSPLSAVSGKLTSTKLPGDSARLCPPLHPEQAQPRLNRHSVGRPRRDNEETDICGDTKGSHGAPAFP
jgi:hypothetical protein